MCGICGLLSTANDRIDPGLLDRMNQTLFHRGPDSGGLHVDDGVGLAARRLSIIDLEGGDQPIANEDRTVWVVQNGEIYNYQELREELAAAGHRLSTRSDTEVHVHLYEEHGPRYVERLRGMFAVALWDARARRLMLARDRFGIKPLYYRLENGVLSFASELKALLCQPDFSREVDLDALEAFLDYAVVPAPLTIFRQARKLPAGHILVWSDRDAGERLTMERYARPAPVPAFEVRSESEADLAEELRVRLRDSVRAHMVADVPVGVMLSGGIDSSALTAFAALESSKPVSTFSIGFEERSFNELDKARLVAQRYDTAHHELVLRPNVVELLPSIVAAFDEPFADNSALPTYLVAQLAARHVKVALSGEGGDELFGGYYTYVADLLAPRFGRLGSSLRPVLELVPSTSGMLSLEEKAKRFARGGRLPPLERHHAWKEVFSVDARAELLAPDRRGVLDPVDLFRARYHETEGSEQLARLIDVDVGTYLVDDLLVKMDRASMAHSLEARVPFCDQVVADLAFALPAAHKVRRFDKKRVLRKALEPLLPPEILDARKQGFAIPIAAWLRGELLPFAREVLSAGALRRQGFFRPDSVHALLDAHVARRRNTSRQLWALLIFSLWFDRYAAG
ncbi:MAG: asparagine synthase (glutamine-hydrolyzing) [Gaiellaceae bacterium]